MISHTHTDTCKQTIMHRILYIHNYEISRVVLYHSKYISSVYALYTSFTVSVLQFSSNFRIFVTLPLAFRLESGAFRTPSVTVPTGPARHAPRQQHMLRGTKEFRTAFFLPLNNLHFGCFPRVMCPQSYTAKPERPRILTELRASAFDLYSPVW